MRTFQAEDEIAAAGAAVGAALRRRARRHDLGRPGHRPQGRDDRARDHARAAARDLRHPARRPVDRDADEARAGRPADGAVRAQQRVAGAGRRGELAVGLLPRGDRGVRGSRSSTARRSISSPTRTSRTAPSRGSCPDLDTLPDLTPTFATEPNAGDEFLPYLRDEQTLARPWALPGTPGLEHRIGGLEKADRTGNISYDPENHDLMTRLRAQKVAGIAGDIPELEVDDPDGDAKRARAQLGRHVRPGRGGRAARPRQRQARRARASAPRQPVPAQHRRRAAPLRQGADPGDEPRPAAAARARRSSSSTRSATTACAASRCARQEVADAAEALVDAA